ncbi:hypothetical protein PV10_04132 [Exophiala mesophila]|uniref:Extracellular membrane protein CFEM domain-containing protein n=1 Tax=Exophiala mesophila TaxID=212818 RepID=A0A0D2A1D9_EXOME|nr:uncharacterized protein PV10_04132 [Exophiala mesophila]KIV92868.1 hypothetical protein PV10_04132 [Exophiala mesophila]
MRFFTVFTAFGFAALVVGQEASSTTSSPTSLASIDPQIGCLQKCGSADVCCQAACVNVPCPSQLQANATTECAAACPQGNGTAEETKEYADCQSACISSLFMTATTTGGSTEPTSGSSNTASVGSNAATTTASSGSEDSADTTSSGNAAGATSTGNSAPEAIHKNIIGLGFIGLVILGVAV